MATPQVRIDNLIPNISVFNLALNVAGIINNKKNVAIYIEQKNEKTGTINRVDVLANSSLGSFGKIGEYTDIFGQSSAIIDCEILETSKLTEHPLEDGEIKADSKIQMPAELSVKVALPATEYEDILANIRTYKNDRKSFIIETKYGIFKNMQLVSIPCSLNVQNVSRITFTLKFRQVIIAQNKAGMTNKNVANPADSTTQSTGLKTGTERLFNRFF